MSRTFTLAPGERVISAKEARERFTAEIIEALTRRLTAEPPEEREARRIRYEQAMYRNKLRRQRYTRHHIHNGRKFRR